MERNLPTPEGEELGVEIARMTDAEFAKPENADMPKRCRTCAFSAGTVPNRCAGTVMDALKALMEKTEFQCHETPGICAGYAVSAKAAANVPIIPAPWPWLTCP